MRGRMARKATKVSATDLSRPAKVLADGEAPPLVPDEAAASVPAAVDCAEILRSAGEAAYIWQIETDRLIWSDNAPAILGLRDERPIASGRAYANLLDAGNARTRFDAIVHSQEADTGSGVPYQVQYAMRMGARSPKLWIEDTGRWFAGKNGKPARAHGLVRISMTAMSASSNSPISPASMP